jgi:shikimate kinase
MPHDERKPIALIGIMGSGKTVVAREIGERLGTSVADLDALIESEEGRPIARLFERQGEPWFRRREGVALDQVLGAGAGVIACGGGIVLAPAHRRSLRERCFTVWLEVTPAEAAARLAGETAGRPLLADADPAARLAELLDARAGLYAETAHRRVDTSRRAPAAIADEIITAWRGAV